MKHQRYVVSCTRSVIAFLSLTYTYSLAHSNRQPEVGGIVCRLPLEVEIYRNFKHSLIGKKLRKKESLVVGETKEWYKTAQTLVEAEMHDIAENAQGGQIDASTLSDEAAEMLQLYIDNQVRLCVRMCWLRLNERGVLCYSCSRR